jgi:hypothetical protein
MFHPSLDWNARTYAKLISLRIAHGDPAGAVLRARCETRGTEALQTGGDAVDILGSDIEMHAILNMLLFRNALQYQRRMGWILGTKKEVRFKKTDLAITKCDRPEICETFRILAIDHQIYVWRHSSPSLQLPLSPHVEVRRNRNVCPKAIVNANVQVRKRCE